jgi:hypothetical protein
VGRTRFDEVRTIRRDRQLWMIPALVALGAAVCMPVNVMFVDSVLSVVGVGLGALLRPVGGVSGTYEAHETQPVRAYTRTVRVALFGLVPATAVGVTVFVQERDAAYAVLNALIMLVILVAIQVLGRWF